jgi:hypothetical protein
MELQKKKKKTSRAKDSSWFAAMQRHVGDTQQHGAEALPIHCCV